LLEGPDFHQLMDRFDIQTPKQLEDFLAGYRKLRDDCRYEFCLPLNGSPCTVTPVPVWRGRRHGPSGRATSRVNGLRGVP
jgi:hypothetical protein